MRHTSLIRRGASLLLAASALHTAAWSIVGRHDRPAEDYITSAGQPPFAGVGILTIGSAYGSGTVIADGSWVLTAAHVVDFGTPSEWSFVLGTNTYSVAAIILHPNWTGDLDNGHDIALVKLNSIVSGVLPAQIYTGDPNNLLGAVGYSVGYGGHGDGLSGYTDFDDNARAMENVIDTFFGSDVFLSDFDHPDGTTNALESFGSDANPLDLEGMGAPGDSGGPVFVVDANYSSWYIAGVHSFIADVGPPIGNENPDARYGDILGSTRVDLYANWINSTVPEPASMTALAVGLVGMLARRRRR